MNTNNNSAQDSKKIATVFATVLYTFPLRKSKCIQKKFSKNPLKSRGYKLIQMDTKALFSTVNHWVGGSNPSAGASNIRQRPCKINDSLDQLPVDVELTRAGLKFRIEQLENGASKRENLIIQDLTLDILPIEQKIRCLVSMQRMIKPTVKTRHDVFGVGYC